MGKTCCAEPSLDELFRDIAVQILMRRDGVMESDIRALLGSAKTASKSAGSSPNNHNSFPRSGLCS